MTTEEIEERVRQDARQLRGKVIVVRELEGMARNPAALRRRLVHPPVSARVVFENSSLIRWTTSGWCDPLYEIELLEPRADLADLTSMWVYGTSYDLDGNTVPAEFVIEDDVASGAVDSDGSTP